LPGSNLTCGVMVVATEDAYTPCVKRNAEVVLYILNVSLLATHQADAVAWREWDVFGLPARLGGLTFFLTFNVLAMVLLGTGLAAVARSGHRGASLGCAGLGLLTCTIHAAFLYRDRVAFWTPTSLAILAGVLLVSILLGLCTLRSRAPSEKTLP
jgi:hypothetical protein